MKEKLKSLVGLAVLTIIVGAIFIIVGIAIKVPGEHLSYYYYSNSYSRIEEYVGGDAYNYIIGSNIVGAQIVAITNLKMFFVCFGALFVIIGGFACCAYAILKVKIETELSLINNKDDCSPQVNNQEKLENDIQ